MSSQALSLVSLTTYMESIFNRILLKTLDFQRKYSYRESGFRFDPSMILDYEMARKLRGILIDMVDCNEYFHRNVFVNLENMVDIIDSLTLV